MADFTLSYRGSDAEHAALDSYDAARALLGFQRSLALTTHLAVNGEIITQAPALKNAQIFISPPRQGSWEIVATIVGAVGAAMIAPKDSVLGHFTRSLYDYVLNATLGIDVDFDSTIRRQHQELCETRGVTEEKLDSLIEKTETAVVDLHRPIVWSESARRARIRYGRDADKLVGPTMTPETYEHAARTNKVRTPEDLEGLISSYNANTFKGRIYLFSERRPVPFELAENARGRGSISTITASLRDNAMARLAAGANAGPDVTIRAFRHESSTGRLKSLYVVAVSSNTL